MHRMNTNAIKFVNLPPETREDLNIFQNLWALFVKN
jgi:hypothetical protein